MGCGDASLWTQNIDRIPADMQITLTDISYGMVRDATRNVGADDKRFTYEVMDAHRLYKPDSSYDCVIADHVLFYCDNLDAVCSEILRVLKPGGVFVCSTYSSRHMKEINDLVQQFDDRIELSAERLYEQFGKENGEAILGKYFGEEAEKIIKEIKRKYFDARHNCIAYRVIEDGNIIERSSDDGEPSGTAGAPMLNILQKNNLANVLIIVTRYFGGILLGTGGLVRAYSASLLQAIDKCSIIKKCFGEELEIELEYSELENFKYYCRNNKISIVDFQYKESIICKIELEEEVKQKLIEDFKSKNVNLKNIKELSKKYITKSI